MKKLILMTFIMMIFTVNLAFGIAMVDVACGANHTVLLAEDGTVWTMGDNSVGQCGPTNVGGNITAPTQMLHIPKMEKIFAGGNMTMCVDENGDLYQIVDGVIDPIGVSEVENVIIFSDSDGPRYAILTQNGDVYVMGTIGRSNQIEGSYYYYKCYMGLLSTGTLVSPKKLGLSNIANVYFSTSGGLVCEAKDGVVYKCYLFQRVNTYDENISHYGASINTPLSNTFSEFQRKYTEGVGFDDTITDDYIIETKTGKVINKDEILLYAGADLLVTEDGEVYDTATGSLERNYNIYDVVIADADAGASHKILLDNSGNVWAYGSNEKGQLGLVKEASSEVEIAGIAGLAVDAVYSGTSFYRHNTLQALLKRGNLIRFMTLKMETPSTSNSTNVSTLDTTNLWKIVDLNSYFEGMSTVKVPTLIESLKEI